MQPMDTLGDQGTLEFPPGVTERFVEIECHGCLSGEWKLDYKGCLQGIYKQYLEYLCTCSVWACCFYVSLFLEMVHRHLILEKCSHMTYYVYTVAATHNMYPSFNLQDLFVGRSFTS